MFIHFTGFPEFLEGIWNSIQSTQQFSRMFKCESFYQKLLQNAENEISVVENTKHFFVEVHKNAKGVLKNLVSVVSGVQTLTFVVRATTKIVREDVDKDSKN